MLGKFIVFDGPDGSGKSTLVRKLSEHLRKQLLTVVDVREPGGTCLGEKIRQIIKESPVDCPMSPKAEILLFNACRTELISHVVRPALNAGEIVIADRYYHSTLAYQVFGRKMSLLDTYDIIRYATEGLEPDLVFIVDAGHETCLSRTRGRAAGTNDEKRFLIESKEYFDRVRQGYLTLATSVNNVVVLNGEETEEQVFLKVLEHIKHLNLN